MEGYIEAAKKPRKERKPKAVREGAKANITELRGKLKARKEERAKYDEMARIAQVYQEGGEEQMNHYLFEKSESKKRLTREELESDPKAQEYLKKLFSQNKLGQTFDDFMVSMPTEQEYVENMVEKIKKSSAGASDETEEALAEVRRMNEPAEEEVDETEEALAEIRKMNAPAAKPEEAPERMPSSEPITSEDAPEVSGEISGGDRLSKRMAGKKVPAKTSYEAAKMKAPESGNQRAKEVQAEKAQAAYVRAYREYDPKFTENKPDDLVSVTRPPFFAFGKAAKELKRLHKDMQEKIRLAGNARD